MYKLYERIFTVYLSFIGLVLYMHASQLVKHLNF